MMVQRLSRNQVRLLGECEDVDQARAVCEHLGQGVLPQARLHKLPAREEALVPRVHLPEDLLRPRSSNLACFLKRGSLCCSWCDHLEDGSRNLGDLVVVDHPVVVDVEQSERPGQPLLVRAVGDDVQGEHVLAEVDDAVAVEVEGAEDVAAEVVGAVVGEEHRVPAGQVLIHYSRLLGRVFLDYKSSNLHGAELAGKQLATWTMSSELQVLLSQPVGVVLGVLQ